MNKRELKKYIQEEIKNIEKEQQKRFLEIFMILTKISKTEDIISFTYNKYYLIIQTKENEYIRIHFTKGKRKWKKYY